MEYLNKDTSDFCPSPLPRGLVIIAGKYPVARDPDKDQDSLNLTSKTLVLACH